jgi:hypothetical protein
MNTLKAIVLISSVLFAFACNKHSDANSEFKTLVDRNSKTENSQARKPDSKSEKAYKPCDCLITEILTTSQRYKELTKGLTQSVLKNGGLSFGISLEGSPNRRQDKDWVNSKTFDYTLYEVYAERRLNTSRFSFDPGNKQLYEVDEINNKLIPIEFDKSLLKNYSALCE